MKYIFLFLFFSGIAFPVMAQTTLESNLNKAQEFIDEKKYAEAVKYINKALENKKNITNSYKLSNLYICRGICRFQLGNFSDAESDLDQAIKISPDFLKAFENKNLIYVEEKKYDKVIDNSKAALLINPNDPSFLTSIAVAYFEKRDYSQALTFADSVLNNNPDEQQALHLKNGIYYRQKQYQKAIEIDNLILSKKANDPGAYINRGMAYAGMEDYKRSEADNLFAASLDSSLTYVAYNNIGYFVKLKAKEYDAAIELFNKSILLKPGFSNAYCNRGFCKLQLGDLSGAGKDLQKAIDLDRDNSFAYKNYALLKISQKKFSEACTLLNTALSKGYRQKYDDEVDELVKKNCK